MRSAVQRFFLLSELSTPCRLDRIYAKVYAVFMDTEKINQLKKVAKRTLKILELIEKNSTAQEIVYKTGANRQLVDYYLKTTKND